MKIKKAAYRYVGTIGLVTIIYFLVMAGLVIWDNKIPYVEHAVFFLPLIFLLTCQAAMKKFVGHIDQGSER